MSYYVLEAKTRQNIPDPRTQNMTACGVAVAGYDGDFEVSTVELRLLRPNKGEHFNTFLYFPGPKSV